MSVFPQVIEEGIGFHETGVAGGCEWPCVFWEPNLVLLQEPQVFLITEPSPVFIF